MGCITGLIAKIFLTVFNAAVALTGAAVLGMCAWILAEVKSYGTEILSDDANDIITGLTSVAGFVIVLGALGMLVACCCQNKLFLYTYFVLGGCLVVTVLTFSIMGNVNIERYGNETKTNMIQDMKMYTSGDTERDNIYREHECCGIDGPNDYNKGGILGDVEFPAGCCPEDVSMCTNSILGGNTYTTGCYEQLSEDVGELILSTFALGIFFGVLLLALITSTCLCVKCTDAMPI